MKRVIPILAILLAPVAAAQTARNPTTGTAPLVIPAAAFRADSQTSAYFFSFGSGQMNTSSGTGCMMAPAKLPADVEVYRFRAYVFDNSTGDLTLNLSRKENSMTGGTQGMASVTSSGQSGAIQVLQDDTIVSPVTGQDFSYYVTFCWTGTAQGLTGVEIGYTVPLGDRVWRDDNGNGIQDGVEPGVPDVPVALYDGGGALLALTQTDGSGLYRFDGLDPAGTFRLRFWPPVGFSLTAQDQGGDDSVDSDPDPLTGETAPLTIIPAERGFWDAGIVPDCPGPDETVYISEVGLTSDGNNFPVITFLDPNQPPTVTGYNVYRSSDASVPPGNWPLVASDIVDMDQGTANAQWIDSSGDVSPTGIWYYDVAAYNNRCPAEGPR